MTPVDPPGRALAPSVVALGVVSLLTDVASDMAIPFLPLFLTTVLHAGPGALGLIEGVAESTAALTKYASGRVADRLPRKKPLVLLGYGISSVARPLLALALAPWHVLAVRFVDRVGKGIRTTPRDAIIARDTPAVHRGYAFGYHRSMDNLGAVVGPLVASGLLWLFPGRLRGVFAATAVPGLLAMLALALGVREPAGNPSLSPPAVPSPVGATVPVAVGVPMDPRFRTYLVLVGVFTLADASDTFLLLRARDLGVPAVLIPLAWGALSLVRTAAATPGGRLADRMGRARALALGWALYAVAYAGFGLARTPWVAVASVAVYGGYYGLTEGAGKALVASFADRSNLGRAYGSYHLVTGLLALPASMVFGLLYPGDHGARAFMASACVALVAATGMALWSRPAGLEAR